MTVLPWRRSRAEQLARALHPSAGAARSRASIPTAVSAEIVHRARRDPEEELAHPVETAAEPLVRLCSDARCRRYLRTSTEGRLSYSTGRGPVTLVVPYILSGLGSLLIPVAPFNEARQYVPGRPGDPRGLRQQPGVRPVGGPGHRHRQPEAGPGHGRGSRPAAAWRWTGPRSRRWTAASSQFSSFR